MFHKVLDEVNAMLNSLDQDYIKSVIKASGNKEYWIECERTTEPIIDEEGNIQGFPVGTAIRIEIYFVRDGNEIDCCTLQIFNKPKDWQKDIKDFVKMWGR